MIRHQGPQWQYLVLCWWDSQDELVQRLFVRPRSHEAGHAVAHIALRLPFKYVTIIPEDGNLGATAAVATTGAPGSPADTDREKD